MFPLLFVKSVYIYAFAYDWPRAAENIFLRLIFWIII